VIGTLTYLSHDTEDLTQDQTTVEKAGASLTKEKTALCELGFFMTCKDTE